MVRMNVHMNNDWRKTSNFIPNELGQNLGSTGCVHKVFQIIVTHSDDLRQCKPRQGQSG